MSVYLLLTYFFCCVPSGDPSWSSPSSPEADEASTSDIYFSRLSECAFTTPPSLAPAETVMGYPDNRRELSCVDNSVVRSCDVEVIGASASFDFDTPFTDSSLLTMGERLLLCIMVESAPTGVGRRIIGGGDEGTRVLSLGAGLVQDGLAAILDLGRIVDDTAKVCIDGGGEMGGENANKGEVNPAGGEDNDGGDVKGGGDDVP